MVAQFRSTEYDILGRACVVVVGFAGIVVVVVVAGFGVVDVEKGEGVEIYLVVVNHNWHGSWISR